MHNNYYYYNYVPDIVVAIAKVLAVVTVGIMVNDTGDEVSGIFTPTYIYIHRIDNYVCKITLLKNAL